MWHSCRRDTIAEHFRGKDPRVRALYRRFAALVRRCGPVTVYAQKSRIVFQTRARFAGVAPRKRWLDAAVWLKRRVESPRFYGIESVTPRDHVHRFRIESPGDFDRELRELLREAYAVGCQRAAPGARR
jgi:hypothetical protein